MDLSYQLSVAKHFTREAAALQCYHPVARRKKIESAKLQSFGISEPRGFQILPLLTLAVVSGSREPRVYPSLILTVSDISH